MCVFRKLVAYDLAKDAVIRDFVNNCYLNRGLLYTIPTKKGIREVNWTHEYYGVKRIEEKPLSTFLKNHGKLNFSSI